MILAAVLLLAAGAADEAQPTPHGLLVPQKPARVGGTVRTGVGSAAVRSEVFQHPGGGGATYSFRVDYTASVAWTLTENKACVWGRCLTTCNQAFSKRMLSRKLWWLAPDGPPVLAEDTPNEREYTGGTASFRGPCAFVSAEQINREVNARLRPRQFAEEMAKDRPAVAESADEFLARFAGRTPTR